MFEDEACSDGEKPGEEDTCFERPCFKWYTTPWSEVRPLHERNLDQWFPDFLDPLPHLHEIIAYVSPYIFFILSYP